LGLLLAAMVAGCAAPSTDSGEAYHSETPPFVEANPNAPLDDEERAQIQQALAALAEVSEHQEASLGRELARATLERIADGDVLLGSVQGALGMDRWHMCKDFGLLICEGTFPDDPAWAGDDELAELLEAELDGYMWGNRLYVTHQPDRPAEELAATMVHEVNHVLNRSECSYYVDLAEHVVDDTLAFVEEYRAFFAECFYDRGSEGELTGCSAYAVETLVELDYGFEPDLGSVLPDGSEDPLRLGELILDPPAPPARHYGFLLPAAESWPEDFGACTASSSP
jgi:hypothetical protein